MRPGMSFDERQAERLRLRAEALARAIRHCLTIACNEGGHDWCRGEEPKSCGCLCECHDGATKAPSSEASIKESPDGAAFGRGDKA